MRKVWPSPGGKPERSAESGFLKKSSLALAGARRGGHRRRRSVLAERRREAILKKEFFGLGKARHNVGGTCSNCTFLPRAEKYQKSRPKGDEPTVRPLWTPPLPSCVMGTCSPLPKSASGGKTPFGKRTASALILAGTCTSMMRLDRLTIDAPPRRPYVRPGGGVCGTNGCWNEVFGERFTVGMKFDRTDSSRRTTRAIILRLCRS